jgi:hypothetical protein
MLRNIFLISDDRISEFLDNLMGDFGITRGTENVKPHFLGRRLDEYSQVWRDSYGKCGRTVRLKSDG